MVYTGLHIIEELLKGGSRGVLYVESGARGHRIQDIASLAREKGVQVLTVTRTELDRMSQGPHKHMVFQKQGDARSVKHADFYDVLDSLGDTAVLVLLDGVTDPQNVGAIMRSAHQFGAEGVIVPQNRSARMTATVSQASAGADAYMPLLQVKNLVRCIEELKDAGFWVYGADMGGDDISDVAFSGRVALVMGAEGKGLSHLVSQKLDHVLSIPMQGKLDSLNVSVATGIILHKISKDLFA